MTNRNVMTDMSKEAMELALEALEYIDRQDNDRDFLSPEECCDLDNTITALREALANEALERMAENARELGLNYAPAKQEPVNEGWKLVPVEPTKDMWKAVNKLDDEMAAGNYDGKGCSIEQAWHCLLDASPTPPAQRTWVHATPWRGLTDEEVGQVLDDPNVAEAHQGHWRVLPFAFARAIEDKLRSKNENSN